MPKQENPEKVNKINIRYTPQHNRVHMLLSDHFTRTCDLFKAKGASIDTNELLNRMGITAHRWNAILAGGECTIGELVTYAKHFNVPISKLYSTINN